MGSRWNSVVFGYFLQYGTPRPVREQNTANCSRRRRRMRTYRRGEPFVFLIFSVVMALGLFSASPAQATMHDFLYVMAHDMPESCQNRLWGDVCQKAMNECLGKYADDPSDRQTTNAL